MARTSSLGSRYTSILGSLLAVSASAAVFFTASSARAEGPVPAREPAPAVAAQPPQGKVVTVVSTGADASSVITVSLGDHAGVEDADAETIREIMAHDLASHRAPSGTYEVRMGKLGSRILLVIEHRIDREIDERHILISGVEEAPTASSRLVDALVSNKPIEETQNVTNVTSNEARSSVMKQGHAGFAGGIIGTTPVTMSSSVAAGAELGIIYEADRFALTGHGRLAGGGSSDNSFTYFNLGVGARYFLSESDITPYVGAGTGFSAYSVSNGNGSYGASGMNLYGEVGVEAFRTHRVAMLASVRADAPLFAVAQDGADSKYALPLSLNVGMVFK